MEFTYLDTKINVPTLKIGDYFIHSKYNPISEAEKLAEKVYTPHYAHIIFGYGCGYLLEALLLKVQFNEPIFVIDPLFKNEDFNIHEQHKVLNLYNEDSIGKWDMILSKEAPEYRTAFKVIALPNYDKVFPEQYKRLLIDIKGIQYKNSTNDYTLLRYAKRWQRNFAENMFNLSRDYNLSLLEQKYDLPVVVVSGGPSLNKHLQLLKQYEKQVIIVASGSASTTLINNDIEPHYVVSIDGGMPNYRHFKDLSFKNAKILYTMQNHPGVRESFEQEGYVFNLEGFSRLTKYMHQQLSLTLPIVPGGGSVAHSAFTIAQYISSGPVALLGQDLAFTDNLTHAKNNRNAREVDEAFLAKRDAFQADGYHGDAVWTTPVFYSMKLEFEDLLRINPPKNEFYNCTEGGIKLEGYNQIPFEAFCKQYVTEKEAQIVEPVAEPLLTGAEQRIEKEIGLYKQIKRELELGIITLKLNSSKTYFDNKTIKTLDKIDQKVQKIINQLAIETITVPVTMKVLRSYLPKVNETEIEKFNRVFEQSKTLYEELLVAIEFCLEISENILKEKREANE